MTTLALTAPAQPRLVTGPLMRVFVADFGALTGFYLLLSVVPQYAMAAGASGVGAGFASGVLMLTTVAVEFVTPRLVTRFGYRRVLVAGLLLLGLPALALPVSAGMAMVLTVCVLRGVGLAIVFVVCGALGAALIPAERRGEGLGVFGVVAGLPAVLAMPLGLWLVGQIGYPLVFAVGALTTVAGLATVSGLPDRLADAGRGKDADAERPISVLAGLRTPALLRPSIVFAATATAAGVVITFMPAALHASSSLAATALLVQATTATAARWLAGRYGDRHGASRLLVPGVLVAVAGMLALVLVGSPAAVLAGMALFGTGFGVVQNASMAMMYEQVPSSAYGTVTALWNIAYDGGWGVGAIGFGLLAAQSGYPAGFALTAVVLVVALAATIRRSRPAR